METANPLILWRKLHGLTQTDAAALIGIDRAAYHRIENGTKRGTDETEHKIICATGITRDQLACLRMSGARHKKKQSA